MFSSFLKTMEINAISSQYINIKEIIPLHFILKMATYNACAFLEVMKEVDDVILSLSYLVLCCLSCV